MGTIRVLHLIDGLGLGGAQSYLVQLCRANPYADVRLDVASLHGQGPFAEVLRGQGIACQSLSPARWNPVYLPRLRALLRRGDYDLVHAHLVVSNFICETLHDWLGQPALVQHLHSPVGTHTGSEYQRLLERLMFRHARRYVACSRVVADSLARFKPAVRKRIVTLPNGVDLAELERARVDRTAARRALGLGADDFVIGSAGRLSPLKNYPMLLEAAARLRAAGAGAGLKVVIFGAGGEESALRRRIRELQLEDVALLPGYDAQAAAKLGLLDVFILPSNYEGMPMVLLEAMAAGVACVTTDFASAPEVVDDGRDGLIVPRGDAAALAAAIGRLRDDGARRTALGTQGRIKVETQFSMHRHWQQLRSIYLGALGRTEP